VLGALGNGLLLLVIVGWIFVTAIRRLAAPEEVVGGGLLLVAAFGLGVNLASARLLHRAAGQSLNMRGAWVHMMSDAAGSVAVIGSAVAVLLWGAHWVDPLASMLIAALVLWATLRLLRDTVHVLLEGTPRGMSSAQVEESLGADPGVEAVHHLHLWNLASDTPALSAHVVLRGEVDLHEAQRRGEKLKGMLAERFGIEHSTLELECHACDPVHQVERAPHHRA
jgi:cobalt-zinc-cadmium efflux system protein